MKDQRAPQVVREKLRIVGNALKTAASYAQFSCTCFVPATGISSGSVGVERLLFGLNTEGEGCCVVQLPPPPPYKCFIVNYLQWFPFRTVPNSAFPLGGIK
jgi:hypothetical protein